MLWSFSRDGGVPLYQAWGSVEDKTGTPLCAVWAMTAMAFLIGLPMLHSNEAFDAIGSICASGLYLSCAYLLILQFFTKRSLPDFLFIPHGYRRMVTNLHHCDY
jgi:amino acid transporter